MEKQSQLADLFEGAKAKWSELITRASKDKKDRFGKNAKDAMRFYSEPHDFMYDQTYLSTSPSFRASAALPTFRVTVNKVSELVQLFQPVLYHRNPVRTVTPIECSIEPDLLAGALGIEPQQDQEGNEIPVEQMIPVNPEQNNNRVRSKLISHYLNFTPNELNLKRESRDALTEALIKGRGCLWTEIIDGPLGQMVGSRYDSVDNLLVDPDCQIFTEARYVMRKRRKSIHDVSREFGITESSIKSHVKASNEDREEEDTDDSKNKSTQNIEYYEIYSKMGIAGRIVGATDELRKFGENFGDHVFMVICPDIPYPLNIPPALTEMVQAELDAEEPGEATAQLDAAIRWPIEFFRDPTHGWPVMPLDFHTIPGSPWPMAHITPALGYQKFLDWAYSFMADHMSDASRQFLVCDKQKDETFKNIILNGEHMSLLEIERDHNESWQNILGFLTHDKLNPDFWTIISAVEQAFERATGMSELMYGQSSRQMRSAQEASVKREMLSVRPDDMANMVEDWMGLAARNEAIALRTQLSPADVAPVFGETLNLNPADDGPPELGLYTELWANLVMTDETDKAVSELSYRIEAGSARKPNKDQQIANMADSAQYLLPALQSYWQTTGDPQPLNAWITRWGEANDMDVSDMLITPPPPPEPDPMAEQQAAMEQQKAELEMAMKAQTLQLNAAEHEQSMAHDAEVHKLEIKQLLERGEIDQAIALMKAKAQVDTIRMKARAQNEVSRNKQESRDSA